MHYKVPDTLRMVCGSFVMHFIWGGVLGAVVYLGLAHPILKNRTADPKNIFTKYPNNLL